MGAEANEEMEVDEDESDEKHGNDRDNRHIEGRRKNARSYSE